MRDILGRVGYSSSMTHRSFDSFEEVFAAEAQDRKEADSRVTPGQAAIRPGQYVLRSCEVPGLAVYAEVLDYVDDEEECKARVDYTTYHYRFSRSYSIACVVGEYGDFHVSTVVAVLTPEMWERAKKLGWPSP